MTDEIRFAIAALEKAGAREYASSGPSEEYHLYREAQAKLHALSPDTTALELAECLRLCIGSEGNSPLPGDVVVRSARALQAWSEKESIRG